MAGFCGNTALPRYQSDFTAAITASADSNMYFDYVIYPTVAIGPYKITSKFYVAQNAAHDIILGFNCLHHTHIHLDFGPDICTAMINNSVHTTQPFNLAKTDNINHMPPKGS